MDKIQNNFVMLHPKDLGLVDELFHVHVWVANSLQMKMLDSGLEFHNQASTEHVDSVDPMVGNLPTRRAGAWL